MRHMAKHFSGRTVRRSYRYLLVLLVSLGCDPIVSQRIVLAPSPSEAQPDTAHGRAVAAVQSIAHDFGLRLVSNDDQSRCSHRWQSAQPHRFRHSLLRLSICVGPVTSNQIEVRIVEMITNCWSPKADSLLRAVTDTLRFIGTDVSSNEHQTRARCAAASQSRSQQIKSPDDTSLSTTHAEKSPPLSS